MENLNAAQVAVANAIISYGAQNGFGQDLVDAALEIAYIESRFGQNTANSSSSARGLFQYLEGTWNLYHGSLGDRNDQGNQIKAMFNDLGKYAGWYNDPKTSSNIPKDKISLKEYMYIKHHDGVGFSNFLNAPGLSVMRNAGYDPSKVPTDAGGGGSGGGNDSGHVPIDEPPSLPGDPGDPTGPGTPVLEPVTDPTPKDPKGYGNSLVATSYLMGANGYVGMQKGSKEVPMANGAILAADPDYQLLNRLIASIATFSASGPAVASAFVPERSPTSPQLLTPGM